jgi:hypothetical protein
MARVLVSASGSRPAEEHEPEGDRLGQTVGGEEADRRRHQSGRPQQRTGVIERTRGRSHDHRFFGALPRRPAPWPSPTRGGGMDRVTRCGDSPRSAGPLVASLRGMLELRAAPRTPCSSLAIRDYVAPGVCAARRAGLIGENGTGHGCTIAGDDRRLRQARMTG